MLALMLVTEHDGPTMFARIERPGRFEAKQERGEAIVQP
jgi:hypothetical protein